MEQSLFFQEEAYEVKTCEANGRTIRYRAFMGIPYCANPVSSIQKLNLFVPEAYYHGKEINGYSLHTAPIFMPNQVGGYMEGHLDEPGVDRHRGKVNSVFLALEHGYVVASAGIRGRNTGSDSKEFFEGAAADAPEGTADARMVGRAPALIVDMKAAVRYLRFNRDRIPGDTERIITNGTSAGGALSAMAGATGNAPDYEPYLKEIGAAPERDDIFAASCYCPIHNLEHADSAYEWLFGGHYEYHQMHMERTAEGIRRVPSVGQMTEKEKRVSRELAAQFPAYVNSLHLTDPEGKALTLNEDGEGSFKEYVQSFIRQSAQREYDTRWTEENQKGLYVEGSEIEDQTYLTFQDGTLTDLDWDAFVEKITRMKNAPAFDALDLGSPENDEFGSEEIKARHFTAYSQENTETEAEIAPPELIRMLNPVEYLGIPGTAKHWRIRHGAFDRDTAFPSR